MKFLVLVGDGMGDYPRADLGGKTVLEAASIPNMNWIAKNGRGGLAQTIPPQMHPGSDVANMELMGYDTVEQFTGRGVFEALSMGCTLRKNDVAFRVNTVTLENGRMKDYAAGHITTQESAEIMKIIDENLGTEAIRFYPGVSYRNLMLWSGGSASMNTVPPHDIIGQEYEPYLPKGEGAEEILSIMERSKPLLENTLVNRKRIASGKNPANSLWLWGQGKNLELATIEEKYGLSGGVISAVDLIKGIGIAAGLKPVFVPGATGYIDTNYRGKAEAALSSIETMDFMYVHVEAPDEAGHSGNKEIKLKAVEDFDREVVGPVLQKVRESSNLAVLVTCDHFTPLEKRTHTREPVPFAYYGPEISRDGMELFSETEAVRGAANIIKGHELLNLFIGEFITL
ncbi:MAG: cofactor-independent phosphoglycerate mutase [Candidatus Latescibacterota bacterium]